MLKTQQYILTPPHIPHSGLVQCVLVHNSFTLERDQISKYIYLYLLLESDSVLLTP